MKRGVAAGGLALAGVVGVAALARHLDARPDIACGLWLGLALALALAIHLPLHTALAGWRSVVCGAIFRDGLMRRLCEGRALVRLVALLLASGLALTLLVQIETARWPTMTVLALDAVLFAWLATRLGNAAPASMSEGAGRVASRLVPSLLNVLALMAALSAVYVIEARLGAGAPADMQEAVVARVAADIDHACRLVRHVARTAYLVDVTLLELARLDEPEWVGPLVLAYAVVTLSTAPAIALTLLYRWATDLARPRAPEDR